LTIKPALFMKAIVSLLVIPLVISAQTQQLTLKHGTYVATSSPCEGAAFAVMMSWDGATFSGPHSSKCTTRVLGHQRNWYSVSTTCAALGDGTPDPSGYVEKLSLTRLSNSRFALSKDHETQRTAYRWCSEK
jgi:hypothetical protein